MKVIVDGTGVYRLTHAELISAGVAESALSFGNLSVFQCGEPAASWIEDGGDGRFDAGDQVELVSTRSLNMAGVCPLILDLDADGAQRGGTAVPPAAASSTCTAVSSPYTATLRFEEDEFRAYLPRANELLEEWCWAKLHQLSGPFRKTIELEQLDSSFPHPVSVRIQLYGKSRLPPGLAPSHADHHVEVAVNGTLVGHAEWDNRESGYILEVSTVPRTLLREGDNTLSIRVPPRRLEPGEAPIVDLVFLNWIEVSYPRSQLVDRPQTRMLRSRPADSGCETLRTPTGARLALYTESGIRIGAQRMERVRSGKSDLHSFPALASEGPFYAVLDGQLKIPSRIELDRVSGLRSSARSADYIMIAHPRLLDAIRPLAEFHRRGGLAVEVVDVTEVYDEFSHSVVDPRAIRDFVSYALGHWKPPAPRFLLLVGDASWQSPRSRLGSISEGRNLVPTSTRKFYASDNWFVASGEKAEPQIAVGRLPVSQPEELSVLVEKSIRYMTAAPAPWRRRILGIADASKRFQSLVDRIGDEAASRGFVSRRSFPDGTADGNQERVRRDLERAGLLALFLGHGGRTSWRTASRDLADTRDLFKLEDVDKLARGEGLPVVLAMTCFSGPFNHPSLDSMAERFLSLPDRGAVAVFASSWDNAPRADFVEDIVRRLTQPTRLGEAILQAKRENPSKAMRELYNLLGDPALQIAVPQEVVRLQVQSRDPGVLRVRVQIDVAEFDGHAVVDWLDAGYEVIRSERRAVRGPHFEAELAGDAKDIDRVNKVRVYMWDGVRSVDGLGVLDLVKARP